MSNSKIWKECLAKDANYIVYTEDSSFAARIRDLAHYKRCEIRPMAEYYQPGKSRPFAWQFRLSKSARAKIPALARLSP